MKNKRLLNLAMLIIILVLLINLSGTAKGSSDINSPSGCGAWENVGQDTSVDGRIGIKPITAADPKCEGTFQLTNETGSIVGGGYTLELVFVNSNAMVSFDEGSNLLDVYPFLIPNINVEIESIPFDNKKPATVLGQGFMSPDAYKLDLELITMLSFIDALNIPVSCAIPDETIVFFALEHISFFKNLADESLAGDYSGFADEFKTIYDPYSSLLLNWLKESSVDCIADAVVKSSIPSLGSILARVYSWIVPWWVHYLQNGFDPSEFQLLYNPSEELTPSLPASPTPTPSFTPKPQVIDNNMVYIPPGDFQMGCDPAHNGGYSCESDELPLHTVYLDAYYIEKTEVTNAQYAKCVAAGACDEPSSSSSIKRPWYYGNPEYDDYPVIYVDWHDAENYCDWVGKHLPTEAEWEKAARGMKVIAYPWGDSSASCGFKNGEIQCSSANGDRAIGDTRFVGFYPEGSSPYGAMDMAGNVNEWVSDWYDENYYSSSPYRNPTGPVSGVYKVIRGGSWSNGWDYLRVAKRRSGGPGFYDIGFRCASYSSDNSQPNPPSNPTPSFQATNQPLYLTLSWTGSDPDGDILVYDVYLDAENPDPITKISYHDFPTELKLGPLFRNTTYYWKVVAYNDNGTSSTSQVWNFKTQDGINPSGMVYVPAGEFQMGCDPLNNGGYWCSGAPRLHTVYLDAFYIDQTEVTNVQYAQCVASGACDPPASSSSETRPNYYGFLEYNNFPVIKVSWGDAQDYCSWAGKRLPTEAEWEKAARGTTLRAYPWGDEDPNCSLANIDGCVRDTSKVGSYPAGASPYGVLDMAGNVEEWVSDWYDESYYLESPYANPSGPISGDSKVTRGGDWHASLFYLRSNIRDNIDPNYEGYYFVGFRCAADADYDSNASPPVRTQVSSCPGAPPQRLEVGGRGEVCTKSDPVRLRTTPGKDGEVVASLKPGTIFEVVGGPECAGSDWSWWKVELENGKVGWLAEGGDNIDSYFLCPTNSKNYPTSILSPKDNMEMVFVPAGEFEMGCHPEHNGGFRCDFVPDELPLHTIYLDAYYIDATIVTNKQYALCVAAGECDPPSITKNLQTGILIYGNPEYDDYPVTYVSWFDSEDYCTWSGRRLPTEAEWEKAARGTTVRAYPWGDEDPNCSLANIEDCVTDTRKVGSYPAGASPYGVLDMAGNVKEWVNDWYSYTYYSESPYANPSGPKSESYKVLRSGYSINQWDSLRTANRDYTFPAASGGNIGFRCAVSAP